MTPLKRRQMLVGMGLAEAIPSITVRRSWEYIDDRIPPEGEADGEFRTFNQWVNHASSWIGYTGARCYDMENRPCRKGGDMMRTRDEDRFPVRWYWPERFTDPVIPDVRAMRVREAVMRAGTTGILVEELRERRVTSNMSGKRIEEALRDRATFVDGRWTITTAGTEQTRYELEQIQRAGCVR